MARPKRNNADYFSHDNNMRNDAKIKALRKKFKYNIGYSVYNMLIEVLTESDYFKLKLDDLALELLAGDFDVEVELLTEIIDYCVRVKLLIKEDDYIFSSGLKTRLQGVIDSRNKAKEHKLQQKLKKDGVSTVETPQSKVNKSKVNINSNSTINQKAVDEAIEEFFAPPAPSEPVSETVYQPLEAEQNEDEYREAVKYLKSHQVFELVQKHHKQREDQVLLLFKLFYEQKNGFNELRNKTKQDVMKWFYSWVPKHLVAQPKIPLAGSMVQTQAERAKQRQQNY